MKKTYIKPQAVAQDLCYDQSILMTGSPTFNPASDDPSAFADIDSALAGEDFGLGDGDDDTSWGWNGTW